MEVMIILGDREKTHDNESLTREDLKSIEMPKTQDNRSSSEKVRL